MFYTLASAKTQVMLIVFKIYATNDKNRLRCCIINKNQGVLHRANNYTKRGTNGVVEMAMEKVENTVSISPFTC